MTGDQPMPDPPTDMPEDLSEAIQAHAADVHTLHEAVLYAQELLHRHHADGLPIEPGPGEEIVRVRDHEGYLEVVKRLPGDDAAYLYHVEREPHPGGDDHLHWRLVGRVQSDGE